MTADVWMFIGTGALIAVLGVPLALGKVPPNQWYGYRVRATLSDPTVWYPVNAVTGRWMVWMGMALAATALALGACPGVEPALYAAACTAVTLVGALAMTVAGWLCLRRLK